MFKVAIIGSGMIVNSAHIPAYKHRSDVFEIKAVCDINEAAAKHTAETCGIPHYYTDALKMLKEIEPEVVSVCVPNAFHKEYCKMALENGANVLCEKPLAFTYSDAVELYGLAKSKNKLLVACQSMRYTPDRLAVKEFIDRGELGDIYYASFNRVRRRGIPTWGTFHINKLSCGGALVDIGVHMLDAMLWLMGNPSIESVTGSVSKNHANEIGDLVSSGARTGKVSHARRFDPNEMDVEDFSSGFIRFDNGCTANFVSAWAANMPESSDISLIGKKAGVFIPKGLILSGADTDRELSIKPDKYGNEKFPGHFHVIDNFADALRGIAPLEITPEQTIQVSAVLGMFYRSAAENRPITWAEK